MEGLIPYIYRSVKKSRGSRSDSSGAAQWSLGGGRYSSRSFKIPRPPPIKLGGPTEEHKTQQQQQQRRHRSMDLNEDLPAPMELSSPESRRRQSPLAAKDAAGSRGSARFLACISGAAGGGGSGA